jgi:D-lactate dehydrogenase
MSRPTLAPILDADLLGTQVSVTQRSIDRLAIAHDASHYQLTPDAVATPADAAGIVALFRASRASRRPITFRSGGTSLSGQAISDSILIDTRRNFQRITVEDDGRRVRVEPGVTVRKANAHLLRYGRKLGPDPASEIACTVGGVVANNSSGMACGIIQNAYQTLESMTFVLPSGTTIDTASPDADAQLRALEPALYNGLIQLRSRVLGNNTSVATLKRLFSMKNTMGYGLNSFLDFERPIDILMHLIIGSEGTLAFVAEVVFRTVPLLPNASTGLLLFPTLGEATAVLPDLVATGAATIELMDAQSLRVAQTQTDCPTELAPLDIGEHAAFLIEFQGASTTEVAAQYHSAEPFLRSLDLAIPMDLTQDPAQRAALWHLRKGLYTSVAGARPSGTTALLEDIVVPVPNLLETCADLTGMFERHTYRGSVIFGHAKDGNVHFMLNEDFSDAKRLERYRRFTEEMVSLVLGQGGSLKAEHGTGRIMAPFVRRQYGDELYAIMVAIKDLCDPLALLNPGVLLSDDPDSYLQNLKIVPTVEPEVDRCVECGYCEPTCPSKNVTLTPRQRIVVRRGMVDAEQSGNVELLRELSRDFEYEGIDTCAVDGLCATACPVGINTGDLVRRLRAESRGALESLTWSTASRHWGNATQAAAGALTVAKHMPTSIPRAASELGRALFGADTIPLYGGDLPGGGIPRPAPTPHSATAVAVFFSSCVGSMFGPATNSMGASKAFLALCERAGVEVAVPENLPNMCCGTPWKSKGHLAGYSHMTSIVMPALYAASRAGEIPIVCDATSCTEGLETMRSAASEQGNPFEALRFVDSVTFTRETLLPRLTVSSPIGSVAIHHTCSSASLGINDAISAIARFVAEDVHVPIDWGCCAFAGDRGLLRPELTESATAAESAELATGSFDAYISANRTCEIGMTRATGETYRHAIELLEEATRVG